jgi:topoisomerase IA-like protein
VAVPPVVVFAMREPVTIARAVEILAQNRLDGEPEVTAKALRRLLDKEQIRAKACLVTDGRHPLLFDMWEIEAALANRDPRRVAAAETRRRNRSGVGSGC